MNTHICTNTKSKEGSKYCHGDIPPGTLITINISSKWPPLFGESPHPTATHSSCWWLQPSSQRCSVASMVKNFQKYNSLNENSKFSSWTEITLMFPDVKLSASPAVRLTGSWKWKKAAQRWQAVFGSTDVYSKIRWVYKINRRRVEVQKCIFKGSEGDHHSNNTAVNPSPCHHGEGTGVRKVKRWWRRPLRLSSGGL